MPSGREPEARQDSVEQRAVGVFRPGGMPEDDEIPASSAITTTRSMTLWLTKSHLLGARYRRMEPLARKCLRIPLQIVVLAGQGRPLPGSISVD